MTWDSYVTKNDLGFFYFKICLVLIKESIVI